MRREPPVAPPKAASWSRGGSAKATAVMAPRERKTWIRPLPPLELPTLGSVQAVESGAGRRAHFPAEARIAELFREGEAKGALQQRELEEDSQEEAASERGGERRKMGGENGSG